MTTDFFGGHSLFKEIEELFGYISVKVYRLSNDPNNKKGEMHEKP